MVIGKNEDSDKVRGWRNIWGKRSRKEGFLNVYEPVLTFNQFSFHFVSGESLWLN